MPAENSKTPQARRRLALPTRGLDTATGTPPASSLNDTEPVAWNFDAKDEAGVSTRMMGGTR